MKPLEGVRVLDLTHAMAGPFATMWMADMGAEVIKVEHPGCGDATRGYGPFINGKSAYFATLNRSKKYVSIDLKKAEGRDLLLKLAEKCDILLNNFRPGVMEKLGLGYEAVKAVNKKIVYACISGFGQEGPYSQRPCYDVVAQAMGGIMSITGRPEDPPTRVGASIGDVMGGMSCLAGMLGALYEARKNGIGQVVDVALVDSIVTLSLQDYSCWFGGGNPPQQMGNQYRAWVPYGTYKAMDGYYIIGAGTDQHFKNFCEKVLCRPELFEDERFIGNPMRVKNREALDAIINEWAKDKKAIDICAMLRAADVPFGRINDAKSLEESPQTEARHMIVTEEDPVIGPLKMVNCPIRFPGNEVEQDSPRPTKTIGADNGAVLADWLAMTETEQQELTKSGVLFEE